MTGLEWAIVASVLLLLAFLAIAAPVVLIGHGQREKEREQA